MVEKMKPEGPLIPEPVVWLVEMKTEFGWLPLLHAPRAIVKTDAEKLLAEKKDAYPGEELRIRAYRREP